MTMGNLGGSGAASIEDPAQPDWIKHKSLREIETIRETKKSEIVSQMIHDRASNNVRQLHAMPGRNSFLTIPVLNNGGQNQVYSVKIHDPDENLFPNKEHAEMKLVSDQAELSHWVIQNKVSRPPAWNLITAHNDVILKPGQQLDLLFKFLTMRDVNLAEKNPSKKTFKRRQITIVVVMST